MGYTGSAGVAGPQGPLGYSGSIGPQGYTGSVGGQGLNGYSGSQGPLGYSGSVGYAGSQGTAGVGTQGYTGSVGANGGLGYTGSNGAYAALGYTGSASTTAGPQGPIGYTGSVGGITPGGDIQPASIYVGIVHTPTYANGQITAEGNIIGFYSSDRKFKENVQDIQGALNKVNSIGGKTFSWTQDYLRDHGGEHEYFQRKTDFGVIAQDVEKAFPLAVRTRTDGSLAVDYEKLVALAFAAIKELTARVAELERKVE